MRTRVRRLFKDLPVISRFEYLENYKERFLGVVIVKAFLDAEIASSAECILGIGGHYGYLVMDGRIEGASEIQVTLPGGVTKTVPSTNPDGWFRIIVPWSPDCLKMAMDSIGEGAKLQVIFYPGSQELLSSPSMLN